MIKHYEVAGNVVKINFTDDKISQEINDEFKPYLINNFSDNVEVKWKVNLHCLGSLGNKNAINADKLYSIVPKKAILATIEDEKKVYLLNNKSYLFKEERFILILDHEEKEITATYIGYDKSLELQIRALIKWIFIREAEQKGLSYIHGSAARYNEKNIIFTGNSHSGKSSSLIRLVNDGAKIISDDNVLVKDNKIHPFYIGITIDDDFAKRFDMVKGRLELDKYVDTKVLLNGIDYMIFLKMWNNDKSKMTPLDYNSALLHLMRIYKKEVQYNHLFDWDTNGPKINKDLFNKYSKLLESVKCYEFFAGNNEVEVRTTLLRLLNED